MLRRKEKELRQGKSEDFKFLLYLISLIIFLILNIHFNRLSAQDFQVLKGSNLDSIEEKIFHEKFSKASQEERISRLEDFVFGKKYTGEDYEKRIKRIVDALHTPIQEEKAKPKPQSQEAIKPEHIEEPKIIYDESVNTGVIGAISQIENKVFNKTFNDIPFSERIAALEEKLLSRSEIVKNKKKPLLERVTVLVHKAGLITNQENLKPQNKNTFTPQSYTIDPKTGLLINEKTGEIVKDNLGNPISVMLPQALPLPQSQFNPLLPNNLPYGNPSLQAPSLNQQLLLQQLLQQQENNNDDGADLGY